MAASEEGWRSPARPVGRQRAVRDREHGELTGGVRRCPLGLQGGGGGDTGHTHGNRYMSNIANSEAYLKHRKKIDNMKPRIDMQQPPVYAHLQNKAKKIQMAQERNLKIENENKILLEKLSRIAGRRGVEGSGLERKSHALQPGEAPPCGMSNYKEVARHRELKRIQNENQAILKRIMEQANKKSAYDKKSHEEDWQKTQRYRELASNYTPPMKQKRKVNLAASPRRGELDL